MIRRSDRAAEVILLAMACLSPWAFGAVRAWAEAGLYLGVTLLALLRAASGPASSRPRGPAAVPGLALAGLVVLALAQSSAWPGWLVGRVAPHAGAFKASLTPGDAQGVKDDAGPPVAAPGPAISQCPELTADVAARLAAGWVLFQVVLGLGGGPGVLRRLGLALAANAALVALFSLVQLLTWNGRMYWVSEVASTSNGGPFFSKNHLAAYLNLGLGFALSAVLVTGRAGRGRRLPAAYAAGLIAVGVLASLARGGFVAMVTATALLLIVAKPGFLKTGAGAAVMLGLSGLFLASAGVVAPYQRVATLFDAGSYGDRIAIWTTAFRAWSAHPVLGSGLGTFAYSGRFFDRDDGFFIGHAENEYLEALVDGGLIGLALAALILVPVVVLGLRALSAAPDPAGRAAVLGALFGVVALAMQCLSDFPLHIPAIAVVAVILAAHLVREGRSATGGEGSAAGRRGGAIAAAIPVVVSLFALWHGAEMAAAEAALADGDVPPPGFAMPTTTLWETPMPRLARARSQLENALRHRPDWAEGHVRLGIVLLSQYQADVTEQVAGQVDDPGRAAAMADPVWLHNVVHTAPVEALAEAGGVTNQEPVRLYLVPAARSFLEARRCCPVWGLPHAELASLDYLLTGRESVSTHARRALRLAGPDSPTIAVAARAAAQAGDLKLAALGWRRMIEVGENNADLVVEPAAAFLTPEQILTWVVPDGRSAFLFADRLYARDPADRSVRDRFLESALARLPLDRGLPEAERLALEARALAQLDRTAPAIKGMTAALALEPERAAWRKDLVEWLIGSGKLKEAHDQAVIGLNYTPDDPDALRTAELAAEALSRGSPVTRPVGP